MFINNGEVECTPQNTYILEYPNDILNGVLVNLSETDYAFVSRYVKGYKKLRNLLMDEGVQVFDLSKSEIDYTQEPHTWVVHSVGKLIVNEAMLVIGEGS